MENNVKTLEKLLKALGETKAELPLDDCLRDKLTSVEHDLKMRIARRILEDNSKKL